MLPKAEKAIVHGERGPAGRRGPGGEHHRADDRRRPGDPVPRRAGVPCPRNGGRGERGTQGVFAYEMSSRMRASQGRALAVAQLVLVDNRQEQAAEDVKLEEPCPPLSLGI